MARIVMQYIGEMHGQQCYAPMDADDIKAINGSKIIVADIKADKTTRTELQNRSIHLYMTWLSEALNNAGYDMTKTLAKLSSKVGIPWTPSAIKERLWRPVQEAAYDVNSTTKLDRGNVGAVYESLNAVTAGKLGVSVPFPDKYMKIYEAENAKT
jgi:hypothetical protein